MKHNKRLDSKDQRENATHDNGCIIVLENDDPLPRMTCEELASRVSHTKPANMFVYACCNFVDTHNFVNAISNAPTVKSLGFELFSPMEINQVLKTLRSNCTITQLDISQHIVTATGATHIPTMTSLERLNMSFTIADDDCAREVSQCISIRSLSLNACKIRHAGAAYIASMPRLEVLDISDNKIKDEGASALLKSSTIRALDMSTCRITDNVDSSAVGNTTVLELAVSSNYVGDVFAEAVSHNTTIRTLRISDCRIGSWGAVELLHSWSITSLSFSNNPFLSAAKCWGLDRSLKWIVEHNKFRMRCSETKYVEFVTLLLSARKKCYNKRVAQ